MSTAQANAIPLLDLRPQYASIRDEIRAALDRVLDSQHFILGPEVEALEQDIARYCRTQYAVGCASGSDALLLALRAAGVGPGDEVVTVPYTFFATAGSIVHAGATPVFVDVEPSTFNMDVAQLARTLDQHSRTRAILPVHLYGACADMDPILALARERGIRVIEDAAQAIGAEYRGRRAGSLGALGCFSFFPTKNLGGFGEGGMVTTDDAALAERMRSLRVHGSTRKYYHEFVGWNSRLDALQAAVLNVKLRHLDGWTEARQRNAALYRRLFTDAHAPVTLPAAAPYQTRHVYNQFVIRAERRDDLRRHLAENGVGTEIYYPIPLHLQPCFAGLGYRSGDFPASEELAATSLALPIHPDLAAEDIQRIVELIAGFFAR